MSILYINFFGFLQLAFKTHFHLYVVWKIHSEIIFRSTRRSGKENRECHTNSSSYISDDISLDLSCCHSYFVYKVSLLQNSFVSILSFNGSLLLFSFVGFICFLSNKDFFVFSVYINQLKLIFSKLWKEKKNFIKRHLET